MTIPAMAGLKLVILPLSKYGLVNDYTNNGWIKTIGGQYMGDERVDDYTSNGWIKTIVLMSSSNLKGL